MTHHVKVALIYGGKSGEHEVSLRSAASVFHRINPQKYEVTPIAIDKEGRIFVHDPKSIPNDVESLPVHHPAARELPSLIHKNRFAVDTQCVFPAIHGPLYEDGCLQGLLEMSNTPYVGCDVLSSALGMDKDIARRLVCDDTLPCARYGVVDCRMTRSQRREILEIMCKHCNFPLFIKPCALGSSVGIHKVHTEKEAYKAIDDALRYDQAVLIEEFLDGREIEISVLESLNLGHSPLCSVPGEVRVNPEADFYSYDVKYLHADQCSLIIPAELPKSIVQTLQKHAGNIFSKLKCKGMARIDFFVNEARETIYFNEINTLPGFTAISMYPKLWEVTGISYTRLLDDLISLALREHGWRVQRITSYV